LIEGTSKGDNSMKEKIKWTTNVTVTNGPSFAFSETAEVEAYEKLQITVVAGQSGKASILPEKVNGQFLVIKASAYTGADPTKGITYKVGDEAVRLTGALVLTSAGALQLLKELKEVEFTNNMESDVTIEILVGRDAGPSA
jgi:lipopolysaccharide export system protein LptA